MSCIVTQRLHFVSQAPKSSAPGRRPCRKAFSPKFYMQRCTSLLGNHVVFTVYVVVSVLLALVLLIDPLFNKPSGLITSALFTGKPTDHGEASPCAFDYEGSWQIGLIQGPSPVALQVSNESVITCSSIGNQTAASYVAEPFLVIPPSQGGKVNQLWYAFYQLKNLRSGKGEIGVAQSSDLGQSWTHLGVALSSDRPLSSPFVTLDEDSNQYVMIPDTHKSRKHAVELYVTSKQEFPFGWRFLKAAVFGEHFMDTTATHYQGQWWIFTTVKQRFQWNDLSYSLRLYHAKSLTGQWIEHPMSPVTGDLRYARGGGRPFVYDGHVYRWSQDDSDFFGESLHLFKASLLDNNTFLETYTQSLEPSGNGNWYSARTHHVDVQPVGVAGSWFGLVDGDRFKDGNHHFFLHEAHFVRLKHRLLRFDVEQLLLVCVTYVLAHTSGCFFRWFSRLAWVRAQWKGQTGVVRIWSAIHRFFTLTGPELQLVSVMILAGIATIAVFSSLPQLFWCPRSLVKVDVTPSPPVRHQDPRAPYDVSDLVVVTGATASFFDRMSNMVGSIHTWEPHLRVIVYDLGFSQSQLAQMMCWENVEVRRFPYEKYPAHVMDVRNYAFKTLVMAEAMADNRAVLWIDSGLELRTDISTLRHQMAEYGHVSAMQEDLIGDSMYTYTKTMVDFFGLSDQWSTVRKWQFCAGGLQGFIRDSDADRLVLRPVVNCSLHEKECIAPPGSSRKNHNFDQTALTLMIWQNNFSCLPRETHCMWSVKKTSANPLASSEPIEMVSRGHRLPKPYSTLVRYREKCIPDKSHVPWPAVGLEHQESLLRYNLTFRISRIYLQPIGDATVQCAACLGAHAVMHVLFWLLLATGLACGTCAMLRQTWRQSPQRRTWGLTIGVSAMLAVQGIGFYLASHIR